MILTESTDEAIQREQRRRKEVTDKLMVDDDTNDEFLDSENESIHYIITNAFTITDDLLL